jgi:hypothetical protein
MAIPLTFKTIPLYKRYNLLTRDNKVKKVNPTKCKDWLNKLNLSEFHTFKLSLCSDGEYRIFIDS